MSWDFCIVSNKAQFKSVYDAVIDYLESGEKVDIQLRKHQPNRRESQNSLQFHWFRELEKQGSKSADEYRAYCKLHLGVPIAREDEGFRAKYDESIKPLDYAVKLQLMSEPFDLPITRHFTVEEMARYLSAVEKHFAAQGYKLTTGDDLYFQAIYGKARNAA